MVRFIFVCMGVTALSLLSLAANDMLTGISEQRDLIVQRDLEASMPQAEMAAIPADVGIESATAESLNDIETASGAIEADTGFGSGFTGVAPKGLEDVQPTNLPSEEAQDALSN